ncbi:MAG: linear amide C-N hydrolase [Thermoclostridium sp.]|nr:linear amide C-N hydrolase [Thermoclostridium sp.]
MKKSKARKVISIIFIALLVIVMVVVIGAWSMFGTTISAANTIEKLDEGLYSLTFKGEYGFDEFIAQGGASNDEAVACYLVSFLSNGFYKPDTSPNATDIGCSTITANTPDDKVLFGRNYDWEKCSAMIVHTIPKNGYASVSTCCLDFLGFDENWQADGSMMDRMMAIASIYVCLDGMNEKGLMIADLMAGDKVETHQDTEKCDLTTTTAIRLILDKAATVDEAVTLLEQYDMNSSIGAAHHFSICDASGKSVVVEYIENEMYVTETKVVTNHYLTDSEKYGIGSNQSHIRFDTLTEAYYKTGGVMGENEVRDAMKSVAQLNFRNAGEEEYERTMWSIVYNPAKLTMNFYWNEDFEHPLLLNLSGY